MRLKGQRVTTESSREERTHNARRYATLPGPPQEDSGAATRGLALRRTHHQQRSMHP